MFLGPADKISHDKEISGKFHIDDDFQLARKALAVNIQSLLIFSAGRPDLSGLKKAVESGLGFVPQPGGLIKAFRNREVRQVGSTETEFHVTAHGDCQGVSNRFRQVVK